VMPCSRSAVRPSVNERRGRGPRLRAARSCARRRRAGPPSTPFAS
jgi:hypothetical protein